MNKGNARVQGAGDGIRAFLKPLSLSPELKELTLRRISSSISVVLIAALLAGCSGSSLSNQPPTAQLLSISHAPNGDRVMTIAIGAGSVTRNITVDESVTTTAAGRIVRDEATINGKPISVTYTQNNASNTTTIAYTGQGGTMQTLVKPGLIGYASDSQLSTAVSSALNHHHSEVHPLDVGGAAQTCAVACLEFLLVEGVGYIACYVGCLAAAGLLNN